MRAQALDAADFGVPQNRKRLFIFRSRKDRPATIEPACRAQAPDRTILAQPVLSTTAYTLATLDRVQNGISEVGRGVDFLTVYYGSDKADGYQTVDCPLRTLTTLDRFVLVQWKGYQPTLRMHQTPELKQAVGLPDEFDLGNGTRRDRIRLLGNGVCPPIMRAVVESPIGTANRRKASDFAIA